MKRFLSVLIVMILILCTFSACVKVESPIDTDKQTDEIDESDVNDDEGGYNGGSIDNGSESDNNNGNTGDETENGNNNENTDGGTEGGNSGSTEGGNSGSTEGGNSGSTEGGNSGNTEGGNGGSTEGGNSGSTEGGNSGSTEGGNSGSTEGGNSGSTEGGNSGSNEGGNSGSTEGGNSGDSVDGGEGTVPYVREGNYIYFGEYPQSIKASSVTITSTVDSRGYFLGSDNAYYAKVVASPFNSAYKFSSNQTVTSGTAYYFKVEPIKWRIISENSGKAVLLCESIIDSSRYDSANSNYKDSDIRAWLNGTFYSKAFGALEAALIQTVTVDNSLSTTGYTENANVCANTSDKVYLLSYKDVTNSAYGFSSNAGDVNVSRMKKTSDYAISKGAYTSDSSQTAYKGNGIWMLRTPNDTYNTFIRECDYRGMVTDGGTNITSTFFGVAPAITISLVA